MHTIHFIVILMTNCSNKKIIYFLPIPKWWKYFLTIFVYFSASLIFHNPLKTAMQNATLIVREKILDAKASLHASCFLTYASINIIVNCKIATTQSPFSILFFLLFSYHLPCRNVFVVQSPRSSFRLLQHWGPTLMFSAWQYLLHKIYYPWAPISSSRSRTASEKYWTAAERRLDVIVSTRAERKYKQLRFWNRP